jgi:hypothetical protein
MEFDNIETIKRAVEIDAGVALLPQPTVLREVETGTLVMVPLASDELVRPLGIIYRRGKELGSTTRRFIELLQSEGQQVRPIADYAANSDGQHNGHPSGTATDGAIVDGDEAQEDATDRRRRREYAKAK